MLDLRCEFDDYASLVRKPQPPHQTIGPSLSSAYLDMAERILRSTRRPMRPREMIEEALLDEALPVHLYGARRDRTLQARLSEDIARNRESSRFLRTEPGMFYLRRGPDRLPTEGPAEYLAKPRRKELDQKDVLSIIREGPLAFEGDQPFLPAHRLLATLNRGAYHYRSTKELLEGPYVAVHSFVVVHRNDMVLSFRCGKFYPETDPLFGKRSIGLGGPVLGTDLDFLYESFHGVVANGIDELAYGIGLPRRLSERARYGNQVHPWMGVISDEVPDKRAVLHVVMGYRCPDEFSPTKRALSVNDLRWIEARPASNDLRDYDSTTRFLFSTDSIRKMIRRHAG